MKRSRNLVVLLVVVALAVLPFFIVDRSSDAAAFTGADDKAKTMIGEIAPDYRPWFSPLIEPASGEIASLLFSLQAALGAGVIGYYLGASRTREKMRREAEQPRRDDAR